MDEDFKVENDKIDIRDYEISEAEEVPASKKRKPDTSLNKKGRPTKNAKYEFTAEDKKLLIEGAKQYGTSYASIQKDYFNNKQPPVTRGDIANQFKQSKFLAQIASEAHKNLKENAKKKFVESFEDQTESQIDKTKQIEIDEKPLSEAWKLFEYSDAQKHVYFLRLNLAEDVDILLEEKSRKMTLEVRTAPFLTEGEKKLTNLYKTTPEFNVTLKEEDSLKIMAISLPDDVILETIERNDVDTEYGWLLEVLFKKKERIDNLKLKGKRFGHIRCSGHTTVPLNIQNGLLELEKPAETLENK